MSSGKGLPTSFHALGQGVHPSVLDIRSLLPNTYLEVTYRHAGRLAGLVTWETSGQATKTESAYADGWGFRQRTFANRHK